jgi:Family of unknown function (DUF6278)
MPGRKHGIARGIAVFGRGSDAAALAELLGQADRLRAWCRARGVALTGEPGDLRTLDEAIAQSGLPSEDMAWLPLDAAVYLGSVLVGNVEGATWTVWPNGHPVVRVPGHGEVDVTDIGGSASRPGGPGLWAIYQNLTT